MGTLRFAHPTFNPCYPFPNPITVLVGWAKRSVPTEFELTTKDKPMLKSFVKFFTQVSSNDFLYAATRGNDADLATIKQYIEENQHNLAQAINYRRQTIYLQTALHLACRNNCLAVVEILLACPGIKINPRDADGITPLMDAAEQGHSQIVKLLLMRLTIEEINHSNRDNQTALTQAKAHPDIVTMINDRLTELKTKKKPIAQHPSVNAYANVSSSSSSSSSSQSVFTVEQQLQSIYQGERPPYFCCPMSGKIMDDPITLPNYGLTFDRKSLIEEFAKQNNPDEIIYSNNNNKMVIKKTDLNVATTMIIKNMIQDFVNDQIAKHKQLAEKEDQIPGQQAGANQHFVFFQPQQDQLPSNIAASNEPPSYSAAASAVCSSSVITPADTAPKSMGL